MQDRPLPTESTCASAITELSNGTGCSVAISDLISSDFRNINSFTEIAEIEGCPSQFGQLGEACGALSPLVSTLTVYVTYVAIWKTNSQLAIQLDLQSTDNEHWC